MVNIKIGNGNRDINDNYTAMAYNILVNSYTSRNQKIKKDE